MQPVVSSARGGSSGFRAGAVPVPARTHARTHGKAVRRLRYNEEKKTEGVEKTAARCRGKKSKCIDYECGIVVSDLHFPCSQGVPRKSAVDSKCGHNCVDWRTRHRWAAIESPARADAFIKRSAVSDFFVFSLVSLLRRGGCKFGYETRGHRCSSQRCFGHIHQETNDKILTKQK